jgi:hypothetical protein
MKNNNHSCIKELGKAVKYILGLKFACLKVKMHSVNNWNKEPAQQDWCVKWIWQGTSTATCWVIPNQVDQKVENH